MNEKNPYHFETERASEKRSFAFERGSWEMLKIHEKKYNFFTGFSNDLQKNSWILE
jgi:hypothetical protein